MFALPRLKCVSKAVRNARYLSSSSSIHSSSYDLFSPYKPLNMPNRIMMAPMTRNRADDQGVLSPLAALYYSQRASAGMIVSESVNISALGQGYLLTPGIYTSTQMAAWGDVALAIERANKDCQWWLQLTHSGRATHISNRTTSLQPLAPSAIRAAATIYTSAGRVPMDEPRAMTQADIDAVLEEYYQAARNSIRCGAHGVELHCGAGFLPHQFLCSSANQRTDAYGGGPAARTRFLLEVVDAVSSAIGAERVGVRVTPLNSFNDALERDVFAMYTHLMQQLGQRDVAFVHAQRVVAKRRPDGSRAPGLSSLAEAPAHMSDATLREHAPHVQSEMLLAAMRRVFPNTFVVSGGFDRATALAAVQPQEDVSAAGPTDPTSAPPVATVTPTAPAAPVSPLAVSASDPLYADVLRHVQELKAQELAQDPLAALMAQLGDPAQAQSAARAEEAAVEAAVQSAYPTARPRAALGSPFGGSVSSVADVVGFGWPFVSTPDLVERLRYDLPLNKDSRAGLYLGARDGVDPAVGYCDYPSFEEVLAATSVHSLHAVLSDRDKLRQVVVASQALPCPLVDAGDAAIAQTC